MKNARMRSWWAGLCLSASLCLAACGGGEDDCSTPPQLVMLGKVTGVALASDNASPLAMLRCALQVSAQ